MCESIRGRVTIAEVTGGRRRAIMLCSAAISVVMLTQGAVAAEDVKDVDPFSLSPEQLFNATVTSVSKSPEKLRDAPAAIYVLTSEDVMRSGATSIPELLRLVPGVDVARTGTAGWAVGVRGFNSALSNKLLVLVDGREIYDPLFSGVYWDIQDIPLEDIDRIEVIRGPGATLWGANAVNGVINIVTKKASDTQGALVSIVSGNEDRALVTAQYGGASGNIHWRVYAKYRNSAPEQVASGGSGQDAWENGRGGFRLDWDRDAAGNALTLEGDVYRSDTGNLRSTPTFTTPYSMTERSDISASGGHLLAHWTRELGDDSRVSLQTYLDLTSRHQITLDDKRTTGDVEAQYELPQLGIHKFIVGFRYRYSADDLTGTPIITVMNPRRGDNLVSGFLQDKLTVVANRLYLTLGSKLQHNDYSGFEVQPSARLQWMIDEDDMAWAAVSRAVRTPDQLEQDLTLWLGVLPPGVLPVPISVELQPNPDFESEELVAYEAGYRRQWTSTILTDVSVFYNDYSKLSTISLGSGFLSITPVLHAVLPVLTTNMTSGKSYGGEAVVNWRALKGLNFSATYSWLKIKLDGPPSTEAINSEIAESQSPRQQFNMRAQWDATDKLSIDSTLYFVDSLPSYPVPSYWRYDIRIGWRFSKALQLDVVGQDLFDHRHREFDSPTDVGASAIGRSIFGRLVWRY